MTKNRLVILILTIILIGCNKVDYWVCNYDNVTAGDYRLGVWQLKLYGSYYNNWQDFNIEGTSFEQNQIRLHRQDWRYLPTIFKNNVVDSLITKVACTKSKVNPKTGYATIKACIPVQLLSKMSSTANLKNSIGLLELSFKEKPAGTLIEIKLKDFQFRWLDPNITDSLDDYSVDIESVWPGEYDLRMVIKVPFYNYATNSKAFTWVEVVYNKINKKSL